LSLRELAAIVTITPEPRQDIAVTITNPGPLPTPQARIVARGVVIDGGLGRAVDECRDSGEPGFAVDVRRYGWVQRGQLPVIDVRTPQSFSIAANGGMLITVAPAEQVQVVSSACGEIELTSVRGAADIAVSGRGANLKLVEAGEAEIRVAGASEVDIGFVRDGLAVSIAGAGDVSADRIDGPTNIAIQGAGDVAIREGHASTLSVVIAGAGDVRHGGVADKLDAVILGAGDVSVRRVDGEVSRRVLGVGSIQIAQQ